MNHKCITYIIIFRNKIKKLEDQNKIKDWNTKKIKECKYIYFNYRIKNDNSYVAMWKQEMMKIADRLSLIWYSKKKK